jgi:hypothetical protein
MRLSAQMIQGLVTLRILNLNARLSTDDTCHNDTQNDTWNNDTWNNDTQHK